MKTITVTFSKAGTPVGTAVGQFNAIPGEGPVKWSDNIEAHLLKRYRRLPTISVFDSQTFAGTMERIAGECGLTVVIESHGAWKVYSE